MTLLHEFKREERLPSYFANRLQDFLSGARTDLRLTRKSNTEVEVAPAEPYGIAAIDLQGLWRFRDTAVTRAHPGGAGGTYPIWAVGTKQKVSEVPKSFTDETDYSFDLRITSGANPAGAGVEVFEKIGEVDWDGAKITALRQTYNAVTGAMLDPAALDGAGDLEWLRQATGALLALLKENSVTAAEIAPKAVAASEIDDSLKPSAGAAAGTEALRALGTTASTAAAGNDSRLSDERTPKDNSVTSTKIVDKTIVASDISDTLKPSAGAAAGTEALRALGETASTAAAGNDARLSDERTPKAKSVTAAKVADELKPSAGAAAGTESLRALGATASTAAAGNDARLSDERTPKAESVTMAKLATALKEALQPRGGSTDVEIAAEEIKPSSEKSIHRIFGGGTVKTIKATFDGHVISFRPTAAVTWKSGGNIILQRGESSFVQPESTLMTFVYDAFTASWREIARSSQPRDWGVVEALPATPSVGDSCTFVADKANGVKWHLVYDGETAFPWKKVGGPPLTKMAEVVLETASAAYQTTSQPAIATPLAGIYDVEYGASGNNNTNEDNQMRLGLFVGAVEDGQNAILRNNNHGNGFMGNKRLAKEIAKGGSVNARYKSDSAKASQFFQAFVSIDPIRVG